MEFRRPEHRVISEALASMDADLLVRCRCYFGGGTAIVLKNGEYRLSLDVDFLCSDADGYRELRVAAVERGVSAFFGPEAKAIRDFRTDQYGLRTVLAWRGQPIKFEIVREGRIDIGGALDPVLGIPLLAVEDQFAEKLLANADRGLDRSVGYRDAVDLGYLAKSNGGVPPSAVGKAELAYGQDVPRKVAKVLERLADPANTDHAAGTLSMAAAEVREAAEWLRVAASAAWPDWDFPAAAGSDDAYEP